MLKQSFGSVLIAILMTPLLAMAEAEALPDPISVLVEIDVTADGRVAEARLLDELPEATALRVQERVTAFEFEPATRDGLPVRSRTTLFLEFAFEALDDGRVAIRIRDAYTAPRFEAHTKRDHPPRYPLGAIRERRGGDVTMELTYDASGQVTRAIARKVEGPRAFGEVTEEAAINWRLVPEEVDGSPVAGTIVTPVYFRMNAGTELPEKRWMIPVQNRPRIHAQSVVALRSEVADSWL